MIVNVKRLSPLETVMKTFAYLKIHHTFGIQHLVPKRKIWFNFCLRNSRLRQQVQDYCSCWPPGKTELTNLKQYFRNSD